MNLDISKYRKNSAFYKYGASESYERQMVISQAIDEFELYQQYAPNTHKMYINGSLTPILGTIQDVSDLEVRADTKWLLTSLKNKVNSGDIILWDGIKWICIYDKEQPTQNCYTVKIQPCNYAIKIPYLNEENIPSLYTSDSIIMTYLTDTKDFKQPFPTEVGTTFATVQFNEINNIIQRKSRIWLYDSPFEVTGVDFTNINFYTNKGFLKWTLRPDTQSDDYDNKLLGVCDYYRIFNKSVVTPIDNNDANIVLTANKKSLGLYDFATATIVTNPINESIKVEFEGDTKGCLLSDVTNNGFTIKSGSKIGIVYIKCSLVSNPSQFSKLRFTISG
jgi:hypothetical protein